MRKIAIAALSLPAGVALVLGAEIVHAVRAERLPETEPYDLDGVVGADGEPVLRMTWIGDSVSAGVGASGPEHALPRLVARRLARPIDLEVLAVSGDTVEDALRDQVPRLERLSPVPDVVIVEIGANDVTHLTTSWAFRKRYEAILDRVTAIGADRVFALGVPAFGTTPRFLQPLRAIAGWRASKLDAVVREVVGTRDVTYVDIAGPTGPRFAADPLGTHAADLFHPNDSGYEIWADAVLEVLGPALVS